MAEKPNSSLQVNRATTPGGKTLAMYEFPDPESKEGCEPGKLLSEAVTLTTGRGKEIIGPQPPSRSLPVVVTSQPEKLHNGEEFTVGAVAVKLFDKNRDRTVVVVQNVGDANIRVGVRGVTPTTGLRLVPNAVEIIEGPDPYLGEVWAVAEGIDASTAFAQEATRRRRHHHHHRHHHGPHCDPDCAIDIDHDLDDAIDHDEDRDDDDDRDEDIRDLDGCLDDSSTEIS